MRLKVCGMNHNIAAVAGLSPEYLGFIFYDKSPRNFTGTLPELDAAIKKVGVFVNPTLAFAKAKIKAFDLDVIQLHGEESAEEVRRLKQEYKGDIWKVFSVGDGFDFEQLQPYEGIVDGFLFDTKGAARGGNGVRFDWSLLERYVSKTPMIVSGGIGLKEIPAIKALAASPLPILAIDVNSRFEDSPGQKNIEKLKTFKQQLAMAAL